jgi:hypothetical protein
MMTDDRVQNLKQKLSLTIARMWIVYRLRDYKTQWNANERKKKQKTAEISCMIKGIF